MNKLVTMFVCAGVVLATRAAQLDWSYTATSSDVGQTVYVMLGAEAVQEWENLAAVQSASVSKGEVVKIGRTSYGTDGSFSSDKISKDSANIYFVVVSQDGTSFGVTSVSDMTESVYDPANQESSPGQNTSLSSSDITKSGIAWGTGGGGDPDPGPGGDVPEPTSGILLMIGGAALALRRRR